MIKTPKDAICDTGFRMLALVGAQMALFPGVNATSYTGEWRGHLRHCRVCKLSMEHLARRGWLGLNADVVL